MKIAVIESVYRYFFIGYKILGKTECSAGDAHTDNRVTFLSLLQLHISMVDSYIIDIKRHKMLPAIRYIILRRKNDE